MTPPKLTARKQEPNESEDENMAGQPAHQRIARKLSIGLRDYVMALRLRAASLGNRILRLQVVHTKIRRALGEKTRFAPADWVVLPWPSPFGLARRSEKKRSLIARSIRVAISAGKTLFAYLGAGCPFRTDWGATSFNVSQ